MRGDNMHLINFPGLGLHFAIDPIAFEIFGRPVHWYGILISVGFLLAIMVAMHEAKRTGLEPERFMDIVLISTPSAIVGARVYYVIFNWQMYKDNLSEIIRMWHGGLAIYGGIIVAFAVGALYCRVKHINLWQVFDAASLGFLVGQCIGRWGNFVNKEAYGRETTLPWRMEIYDAIQQQILAVHPTFFYESFWNLIGFILLFIYRKQKKFEGEIFLMYITWYGSGRFWIEGLRTDSLYIGVFRVSQIVAFFSVVVGLGLIWYFRKNQKTNNLEATDDNS